MQHIPLDHPALTLRGALDFDHTEQGLVPRRLPDWTRPQVPVFMEVMVTQPSGVRLQFATDSTTVQLGVHLTRLQLAHKTPRQAVFDLVCDGTVIHSDPVDSGDVMVVDLRSPNQTEFKPGSSAHVVFSDLPSSMKQCELWLPQGAKVALQNLSIDPDAELAAFNANPERLWLHHGSSISHCAEADCPTLTWPSVAAKLAEVDLLNLGFGGNAQLDPFVARTIRDLPADLISLKLGINVVNMDSMRERTFTPGVHGFIDTIREGHPHTPLLIISPIFCPSAEANPGPTLPDEQGRFVTFEREEKLRAGCLTLEWIRKILSKTVTQRQQQGDGNIHYLDGLSLFGAQDAGDLPDDLHPNGEGYQRMGERFYQLAFSQGAFSR